MRFIGVFLLCFVLCACDPQNQPEDSIDPAPMNKLQMSIDRLEWLIEGYCVCVEGLSTHMGDCYDKAFIIRCQQEHVHELETRAAKVSFDENTEEGHAYVIELLKMEKELELLQLHYFKCAISENKQQLYSVKMNKKLKLDSIAAAKE